jgi:3-mercaptopyruvate sulfurtransferase SseA
VHLEQFQDLASLPNFKILPIYQGENMSRSEVPVSADWVEENLNTPGIVVVEADEDTSAYDGGHITGAALLH